MPWVSKIYDGGEQFMLQLAPQGFLIKCRIASDRNDVDGGLYLTS